MNKGFVGRMTVLGVFVAGCLAFGVYFWFNSGGQVEGLDVGEYRIAVSMRDVDGLVDDSEVRIAGVTVGRVTELDPAGPEGAANIVMTLDDQAAPLHEGVTARIGMKSLIGASFVDIVDGNGKELPNDARLPDTGILPSVELQDVVRGLDPESRAALSQTVQSLGASTAGRGQDLGALAKGLGNLGREGHTALDAIAAQSQDLEALTQETTVLLDTLDTGNGQVVDVVKNAQRITNATAGQRPALEQTVRQLPGVLASARTATGDLARLSESLAPVAVDLRRAAPDLNEALLQLPDTSRDLRGLLPELDGTLDRAPATLDRITANGEETRALLPPTHSLLRDLNPALEYAAPYGRDVGAMLANFASSMQTNVENGVNAVRLAPVVNTQSVRNMPVPTDALDPLSWNNPIAKPGKAGQQEPFSGAYPRLDRAPD